MASSSPDRSDSNLRRRSFRGQHLVDVNFQGADLRGCDFSGANLHGANLADAAIGLAPEALFGNLLLFLGGGAIAFHLLSQMTFGILGLGVNDPNYALRPVYLSVLAIAGGLTGLISLGKWRRPLLLFTAGVEGLLLGFYWGGIATNLSLVGAMGYATLGGVSFCLATGFAAQKGIGILVRTFGLAMANNMFLVAGINMLQLFFVGRLLAALGWFAVTVLYWLITLRILSALCHDWKQRGWTSFAGADLTRVRWK